MAKHYRNVLILIFVCSFTVKLSSMFLIAPGNAPDEIGHLAIAVMLSQPIMPDDREAVKYTTYPYSVYNPTSYVPSAILMKVMSMFDDTINRLQSPMVFTHWMDYVARTGHFFWAILFLIFLYKLREFFEAEQVLTLMMIAFLPQLTFVHGYLNNDAIGISAFLYVIWALYKQKNMHVAFGVFWLMNSKLTTLCVLPLPIIIFFFRYRDNLFAFLKKFSAYILIPFVLGCWWFVLNYFVSWHELGCYVGYDCLPKLFGYTSFYGWKVLGFDFVFTSIVSAFGCFGYMNQHYPPFFTKVWSGLYICGAYYLIQSVVLEKNVQKRMWHISFLSVFVFNWIFHFMQGYRDGQAQGKYLFYSAIISLIYLAGLVRAIEVKNIVSANIIRLLLTIFFVISALYALQISHLNPYGIGF